MKLISKVITILILFLVVFAHPTYAQVTDIPIPTITISPTPTASQIEYSLPYPGILPGSPLYAVKVLRDRVMEMIISDPVKKSQFYLLQADKRLAAGLMLFDRQKEKDAETVISKSQNYLEKSLERAVFAKNSNKNIGDLMSRIQNSSAKQKQEILSLSKKAKGDAGAKLKVDYKRAEDIQKRAQAIKP